MLLKKWMPSLTKMVARFRLKFMDTLTVLLNYQACLTWVCLLWIPGCLMTLVFILVSDSSVGRWEHLSFTLKYVLILASFFSLREFCPLFHLMAILDSCLTWLVLKATSPFQSMFVTKSRFRLPTALASLILLSLQDKPWVELYVALSKSSQKQHENVFHFSWNVLRLRFQCLKPSWIALWLRHKANIHLILWAKCWLGMWAKSTTKRLIQTSVVQ